MKLRARLPLQLGEPLPQLDKMQSSFFDRLMRNFLRRTMTRPRKLEDKLLVGSQLDPLAKI